MSDQVFGHMMQQGKGWKALLPESSSLFCDVAGDKLLGVESVVDADTSKLHSLFLILHWASDGSAPGAAAEQEAEPAGDAGSPGANAARASVNVKHRSLLMIAAYHGSLRVLAYLLAKGAEPSKKAPDGLTAYDVSKAGFRRWNSRWCLCAKRKGGARSQLPAECPPPEHGHGRHAMPAASHVSLGRLHLLCVQPISSAGTLCCGALS